MRKVITYGTFDMFHKGHYNILKRAKDYGDYLIVGVTGERYDAERGKLSVRDSLSTRIDSVKKTGFADQIIVEEYLGQKIADILKYNVDVIVVGSDWRGKFDHLSKYCEVVYLERTKDISSTQLREEQLQIFNFGIATDSTYDNDAVIEPKSVSGIHVRSVFSEDSVVANEFAEKFEMANSFTDYSEFLNHVDIVYIKSALEKRETLIESALKAKRHVVCDVPFSLDAKKEEQLISLARTNNVVLLPNMPLLYLESFEQLSWMARGNIIGDVVSVKCSISKSNLDLYNEKTLMDIAFYPVCMVIKLLGTKYESFSFKPIRDEHDKVIYSLLNLDYKNTVANIEIGVDFPVNDGLTIFGTKGVIYVPEDWWNLGYFKMKRNSENKFKRYSFNFDGNGFRYVIRSMLHQIRNLSSETNEHTNEGQDLAAVLRVLNAMETKI